VLASRDHSRKRVFRDGLGAPCQFPELSPLVISLHCGEATDDEAEAAAEGGGRAAAGLHLSPGGCPLAAVVCSRQLSARCCQLSEKRGRRLACVAVVRWKCLLRLQLLRLRCVSRLQGAPPLTPFSPANTRMRRRKRPPPHRIACGLPSLPPRSQPCLTSCTPHSLRRAVWRTHTAGSPLVAGGTRRLHGATACVRHAFSPRDTPSPATHGLAAAHGPPCAAHPPPRHPCVSLRVPALHSPPDTAVPTRP
jgi:hypothetical protein